MTVIVNKANSAANQWVELLAVPSSGLQYATVSISIVNRDSVKTVNRVAITSTGGLSPNPVDLIEDGPELDANGGKYENEYLVLAPGERILFQTGNSNCVARAHGLIKS